MKTKKILLISILVLFCISVLLCLFLLFSVKEVKVNFTVYSVDNQEQIKKIDEKFDEYSGKNLLFVKEDEVMATLKDNPYFEIISVEKEYPNVLAVEVKERRKAFYVFDKQAVWETTKDGILLSVHDQVDMGDREMIYMTLSGVDIRTSTVGQKLSTSADDLISAVFEMANAVNLTDCINEIAVVKATGKELVNFKTYTGAVIQIADALDEGTEKIVKAFADYYDKADDYEKTRNYLIVFKNGEGEIEIHWSEREYGMDTVENS